LSCEVELDLKHEGVALLITVEKQPKVIVAGVEAQLNDGFWLPADHDMHTIAGWLAQGIHVTTGAYNSRKDSQSLPLEGVASSIPSSKPQSLSARLQSLKTELDNHLENFHLLQRNSSF